MSYLGILARKFVPWMLTLSVICFVPRWLLADASSASLSITVSDTSGAVIPGATATLRNSDTDQQQMSASNKTGLASFPFVKPGHYVLTVTKEGFSDVTVGAILLNVGDERHLQLVLKIGAANQNITVDGSGLTINTTDASVGTVINRRFVANVPLNGRSFQDLISMTPGVVTQSPQTYANQAIGASGDFSINGQRTESNYYSVDGISVNLMAGPGAVQGTGAIPATTTLGTTQSVIPIDALQEFQVQSSTPSADYGTTPGGQLSFLTRSGTTTFHGTAFDYLRNNFFDANDWFNDYFSRSQPPLRQNDFGGALGGPIPIPHRGQRDKYFFFGAYEGLRLEQPQAASIQYVPDNCLRQMAPLALQGILNAYPIQNGSDYGTCNTATTNPSLAQFISTSSLPSGIDSTSVRVDTATVPKTSLFFRLGITPSNTVSRVLANVNTLQSNTYTYTLGADTELSLRINNEFRLGYAANDVKSILSLDKFGGANPVNLAQAMGSGNPQTSEGSFLIIISGIGDVGNLYSYTSQNRLRQWNITDTANFDSGKHQFRVGANLRWLKYPYTTPSPEVQAEFTSVSQVLNNAPALLYAYARRSATPTLSQLGIFAQDAWRATKTFTVSLGLRWELAGPPTAKSGDLPYTVIGNLSDPSSLTVAPEGTPLWKTYYFNLAPRIGIAWVARGAPDWQTVFRSGGGVYFDDFAMSQTAIYGYYGLGFSTYSSIKGGLPATPAEVNIPITVAPPYTRSTLYAYPTHYQIPYSLEWDTSMEQALGKNQSLTLSYVGSNGRRLVTEQELLLSKLTNDFNVVVYYPNNVTSSYNAMEVKYQRNIVDGVQALASYSWSHSIDVGSTYSQLPIERGNSDFDVRNNFQGGLSANLPSVHGNPLLARIADDWGLDLRALVRSGFPLYLSGNVESEPATGERYYGGVNYVPREPTYLHGSKYPGGWELNPAAFVANASATQNGDVARNSLRGFGETQFNVAMHKTFPIRDTITLSFRAEAFNVLNHPNFGYIDTYLPDATFGQAIKMLDSSLPTVGSEYQQGGPRSMQFALRLAF
jgi:hypothetical protein